jgi:hypothetical protein
VTTDTAFDMITRPGARTAGWASCSIALIDSRRSRDRDHQRKHVAAPVVESDRKLRGTPLRLTWALRDDLGRHHLHRDPCDIVTVR